MVEQIKCVYCGSINVTSTKITSRKGRISIMGLTGEMAVTNRSPQLKINCTLCGKKYVCIYGTYFEYLKNHVKFTGESLDDLKRIFPKNISLEIIFKKGTGISKLDKKMQKARSKDYDITFKLFNKRAYLHCKKKTSKLFNRNSVEFIVVSIHEV